MSEKEKKDLTVILLIVFVTLASIIMGCVKYHQDKIEEMEINNIMDSVYIQGYEDALRQNGYE